VVPGRPCFDSSECAQGQYCEYAIGETTDAGTPVSDSGNCSAGAPTMQGKCLPRPPLCADSDAGPADGGATNCLAKCQYRPTTSSFEIQQNCAWTAAGSASSNVMMTPIVVTLTGIRK
jgi:hypothetical protein